MMENAQIQSEADPTTDRRPGKSKRRALLGSTVALAILSGGVLGALQLSAQSAAPAAAAAAPAVTVSPPLRQDVDVSKQFLGQFSAIEHLELRAQVGGRLTRIGFKDGDIVQKGALLFEIDPTPYQIRMSQAAAQLESMRARLDLSSQELLRARTLQKSGAGTAETAEQRFAEHRAAQAAVDDAEAQVRDAKFDLDHCRIEAPFTGRIGSHLVSVGNLIAGSRAGSGPTTLLATLVSTDGIYLNFDMSEADYLAFQRARQTRPGPLASKIELSLGDESGFARQGTLDFIDNSLDRSSGTIHARATIADTDRILTPGAFARVRLQVAAPAPALLVPDAAVLPDQGDHLVLTVDADNKVTPKHVELGDLRGGLRVIRKGIDPTDLVIIGGIPVAAPGAKVAPQSGSITFNSSANRG